MARRLAQTTIDYVVIAISPALIMTLVGSLVFFLIQVFYQGEFTGRLNWVMACFVFAVVLISRIGIEEGLERAAPFGLALAVVVGLAANRFMEYHGGWIDSFAWIINWGLIALVWWCAHKLTWDCTVVDDSQDSSGEGLLQTAGLEAGDAGNPTRPEPEGTTSRGRKAGMWQRYVENQRRPHAPGVWVVYFSLAALPLFGIGQWFIPVSNVAGRRYAFWLLVVYVASGLGLLLTTSFLGLRRYLRQRRIEMPATMANLWLGIGASLVVLLLCFAALLPRPSAEYAISELPISVGSPEQEASKLAPMPREGVEDEQPGIAPDPQPGEGNEPPPGDSTGSSPSKAKGGPPSDQGSGDGAQDQSSGKGSDGKSESSEAQPDGSQEGQKSEQGDSAKQPSKSNAGQKSSAKSSPAQDQGGQKNNESQKSPEPGATPKQPPEPSDQPQTPSEQPASSPQMPSEPLGAMGLEIVGEMLKWVFYGIVILAVLFVAWRMRREIVAAVREFLASLASFWSALWGGKRVARLPSEADAAQIEFPPAPFSSYADPFATGIAARYSATDLVQYSFEAFEAWAREHGCPRSGDQTPHEFARDVGKLNAHMSAEARGLAELYARVAYAGEELPRASVDSLRKLWQEMRSHSASAF